MISTSGDVNPSGLDLTGYYLIFARDGIQEFLYTSNGRDSRQEIPWHLNKTN